MGPLPEGPADHPDGPSRGAIARILQAAGHEVAPEQLHFEPLGGGVSADLWRVRADGHPQSWVAKQPRVRLRVARDWQVSTERALSEVRFHEVLAELQPGSAPEVLGFDVATRLFVMRDYPEPAWRTWKTALLAGHVDPSVAHQLGRLLGRLHAASGQRPTLAARFQTRALFHALRIRPYLHAAAEAHPDLAARLRGLEADLDTHEPALVHGDVSPKNLLVGPGGAVVLLDAECAWWGAPHFDAAFLVSHLMLKWARDPDIAQAALTAIRTFMDTWLRAQQRTGDTALEARVTALVPALLLARVDGLSPVEYLDEARRGRVRSFARTQLNVVPTRLDLLLRRFERAMGNID